jgi:hypothetical protein
LLLDDDDKKSLSHLEKFCSKVDIFSDVLTLRLKGAWIARKSLSTPT